MEITINNIIIFLLSLFIGIIYIYITSSKPTIITKYPTPFNIDKITYIDEEGIYYKYKLKEVECPEDKTLIKSYVFSN